MDTTLEALEAQALKLTASDRSHLLERLLVSLDTDAELEDAWVREADQRAAELDSGLVQPLPREQVMERLYARLA